MGTPEVRKRAREVRQPEWTFGLAAESPRLIDASEWSRDVMASQLGCLKGSEERIPNLVKSKSSSIERQCCPKPALHFE